MEEIRPSETVDLEGGELVLLRYLRMWPHYSVEWTLRRRSPDGESSFPVAQGQVQTTNLPPDWDALRAQALDAAKSMRPNVLARSVAEQKGVREGIPTRFLSLFQRRKHDR
jgi:hypothetical protein